VRRFRIGKVFDYVPDWGLIFKMVATLGSLAAMLGVYLMFRSNRLAKQAVEIQQQERKASALAIQIDDLEMDAPSDSRWRIQNKDE
jgi:hypothetical protein